MIADDDAYLTTASSLSPPLNNEETHHHELSRNKSTSTMFMKLINGKKETIGRKNGELTTITYKAKRVIGAGAFGIVCEAKCLETEETVAIKNVLHDRNGDNANHELQLMRLMDHPNVVFLKGCFFTRPITTNKNELSLNLVMEYVTSNLHRVLNSYTRMKQMMPLIYVKLYTYQILKGLAYIHSTGVCHRDVKPGNVLVDPLTHQVKICDFGLAEVLVRGTGANGFYVGTPGYIAPELIIGATKYTTSVDIWSAGCVLARLLLGQPLFPAGDREDQLVEIIKVLGTPTREEIRCMNPHDEDFIRFRARIIKAQYPWHKVFHKRINESPEAIDLASRLLQYSPSLRCTALQACAHPFFDQLRDPNARLPNGCPLPPL